MTDFNPTSWQEQQEALLAQLPDKDLVEELRALMAAKMRARVKQGDEPPLELLTGYDILTTNWPEPAWAVPELLPVGLAILGGAPKLGKSFLALQMAQAKAAGGYVLGQRVEQGPVLYLALEDTERRLKERMQKQGWNQENARHCHFMVMGEFVDQLGDLRNGGGERLARQIKCEGYQLVIIDTLSRSTQGDQNDVVDMTLALDPVQQIAHKHNCAVLLVDHHRKGSGFDPDAVTDILGSTAKGAMCDTVWGLYRERGKAGAKLAVTGRDIDEKTLALEMDWLVGAWQLVGDADALMLTDRRQEILDALADLGPSTCGAIARAIEQDRSNTYKRLQDLTNIGLVSREQVGKSIRYIANVSEDD